MIQTRTSEIHVFNPLIEADVFLNQKGMCHLHICDIACYVIAQ